MGPTMGLGAPLFLAIWVVMMVAMMFPTTAPMILTFARVQARKRQRGEVFVPTWIFVAAYLVVWIAFGALAFAVAVGAEQLGDQVPWGMDNAARIGGAVLILAGLYQFSPQRQLSAIEVVSIPRGEYPKIPRIFNGWSALRLALVLRPNLIVIAPQLSEISAEQLIDALRADVRTRATVVVTLDARVLSATPACATA
jgi:Predicted metal-binding integral membrane protein (DUF2182)